MMLSSLRLRQALEVGKWTCNKQVDELHFGPNSVDVTLGNTFLIRKRVGRPVIIEKTGLNVPPEELYQKVYFKDTQSLLVIRSGDTVLGVTQEKFDCTEPLEIKGERRYFTQHYEGRSTLARLNVMSHISAGFGDYGFKGAWTLELVNLSPDPIVLSPGIRVGQVYFMEVDNLVACNPYKGYDQTDCNPALPSERF